MSFAEIAARNATFVAGHVKGELIAYRSWPATTWLPQFSAIVDRRPMDPSGQFTRDMVTVQVSKEHVAAVSIHKDEIEIPLDQRPLEAPPRYLVKAAEERLGDWILECERKR